MTSQAEIIIAFIFKRSGKTELSFSDIYLTLSMELNWFTPDDAKAFVQKTIDKKILTKKNSQLRPSFEISKIDIPIGYYPTGKLFEEKKQIKKEIEDSILEQIILRIEKVTNKDRKKIEGFIKKIAAEKNLKNELAALLYGKEHDVDFNELYEKIEKNILE